MSKKIDLIITKDDLHFSRLDQFIVSKLNEYSRSYIKDLFSKGFIKSSHPMGLKKLPPLGTKIEITIPEIEKSELIAEDIPLEILFEDEFLLFINKPCGLVVHPGAGNWTGTLVNALLHHCKDLKGIGNIERPGIVHRLDKGTSGVMVIAKEQKTHELLSQMFSTHDLTRKYEAIVYGKVHPKAGTIESFISRDPNNRQKMTSKINKGKKAITHFKVLKEFEYASHVECKLETGRTHQIRVHLSQQKRTPIINDKTYSNISKQLKSIPDLKKLINDYEHPFLHAKLLELTHPITKKQMSFETKPPQNFLNVLELLNDST